MPQMRALKFALAPILVALAAILAGNAYAQANPFKACEAWGQLPAGRTWGNVTGVGVDHHGNVWAVDRCGSKGTDPCVHSSVDPILEFDSTGKFVKSFGAGTFVLPHSLSLDKDDNLWVADEAALDGKGNIVAKYSPDGKLLLTLGTPGVYGTGPDTFSEVTDAVVAPNGDIFVSDGHQFPPQTNTRIVKYSKDGKFIKAWGKPGTGPGEFHEIHAIGMDTDGRVLAADRANGRVQIFDQNGKYLTEWKQFGQPRGIFVDSNDVMYVTNQGVTDSGVVSSVSRGIRIASARDGVVTGFIPPDGPELETHGSQLRVATDAQGNLYVADFGADLRKCVKK
jgi:streptogramin lyase